MRPKGRKKIEAWLIRNKMFLNFHAIEREIDASRGTFYKFFKQGKLSDKVIIKTEDFIKKMIFDK